MSAHYFKEIGLIPHGGRQLFWSYLAGLVLSLALTLGAYALAFGASVSMPMLFSLLAVLALAQCVAQLFLFLHLGNDPASREKAAILGGVAAAALILVAGSVWIMLSLHERMMLPEGYMRTYMEEETGL